MIMRNIRLVIQYDGSRYAGFQKLSASAKGSMVEEKLVDVLEKMTGEKITLFGATKLEAGVHALHQIANFKTACTKKEYEIKHYLNQYLPQDIKVLHVDDVLERFHSSLNANSFWFEYRITMGEVANVFTRKYNFYSFHRLDVVSMRNAAKELVGVHDFKALANSKKMKKSTIREVFAIDIVQDLDEVKIRIHVDDVWPYMIRKMVGMLYEVGMNRLTTDDVVRLVDVGDASLVTYLAEPQGLFLDEVMY